MQQLGFPNKWFAVQVRPNHERTTSGALREKGYEVLLPTYRCRRKWSDRLQDVELPLFGGYVFCRFDPSVRVPLVTTPGVRRIVGRIEPDEMFALRRLVDSAQGAEPWPYVGTGTTVRLVAGPLAGVQGVVLAVADRCRLVISVTLLQRSVAVSIDQRWVSPSPSFGTLKQVRGEWSATGHA